MSIAHLVFDLSVLMLKICTDCVQTLVLQYGPNLCLGLERSIFIVETKDGYFLARLFEYFPSVIMSILEKNLKNKKSETSSSCE